MMFLPNFMQICQVVKNSREGLTRGHHKSVLRHKMRKVSQVCQDSVPCRVILFLFSPPCPRWFHCFFVQVPSCVIQHPCWFICWLWGVAQTAVPILPTLCTEHRLQKAAYSEGIIRWVCNITGSSLFSICAITSCFWLYKFLHLMQECCWMLWCRY